MSIFENKQGLIKGLTIAIAIGLALVLLFNVFKRNNTATPVAGAVNAGAIDSAVPTGQANPSIDSAITAGSINGAKRTPLFKTGVENLPRSLQGTEVDGEIIIDGDNRLVPTRGLRRLYDYFLSALGEETAATIDARIEAYITSRTPEPAASTAVALYYTYKTYLQRLGTLQESYGHLQMQATEAGELDLNMMAQRQTDVKKIRGALFNPQTVAAFFASEDELEDYNIAMIKVAKDPSLSEQQRQQARLDYVSRLPDSTLKLRVQQKQQLETLMQRTEALKAQGANDAELFAMRSELVGAPAAQRLAEVDAKNKDFESRFEQYQSSKQQILMTTADTTAQQAKITALQQQLFNAVETKRLSGYEMLHSLEDSKTGKLKENNR